MPDSGCWLARHIDACICTSHYMLAKRARYRSAAVAARAADADAMAEYAVARWAASAAAVHDRPATSARSLRIMRSISLGINILGMKALLRPT